MEVYCTDEKNILQLLTSRSNAQRQQIKAAFNAWQGFGRGTEVRAGRTLLETVILALLHTPTMYDVKCLKHATLGAGTSEKVLIHILASRTCSEIQAINAAYKQECGKSLEEDVTGEVTGDFKELLVVLLQANRQHGVQEANVQSDAKALLEAGEKFGTGEDTFITILGNRSTEHLRRVFAEYTKLSGFQIEDSIKKETGGHLEELMLAVVKCAKSVSTYLAECLYNAMKDDLAGDYEKTLLLLSGGDDA
ncbi:annexin A5-like [Clarias magur]|uniref:Annexin n=1 Tax=Clarias magur TaxID=1594786 RepID=A0A8J4X528_CLAMG|nr:annexin A5-like [Clarias magur]